MFPVLDSNLSADALAQHVRGQYPIAAIVRCRLHERGVNDTYKIETDDGTRYFLRVYRAGRHRRAEIDTELAVLDHLARDGAPVSVAVARTDNRAVTPLDCAEGERWAVLFTAAPGSDIDPRAYSESDERAHRYGEAVARIHRAADGFAGPQERVPLDLEGLLERPLRRIAPLLAHRPADHDYMTQLGNGLRSRVESADGLETGFCHGDLGGVNACEAEGSLTFYDFDCCGWGYRAYDLAVFPASFAMGMFPPDRIEALGRAFIAGYMRGRPLAPADIAAIPVFVAVRNIWLMGLQIELADRLFGWGMIGDPYFDHHLRILRDWEANFLGRSADWLLSGAQNPPDTGPAA
jgi:Ser/Thr protein kinase RdoA (MazF antagonist)